MKEPFYFLSIKGGSTGTYAVLLAILSSILAGIITNINTLWTPLFIISTLFLLFGIGFTAWLNSACIKYNERYSDIRDHNNEEERKKKALDLTAENDYNYPSSKPEQGKLLEKKFNKRKCIAIILSLTSIVLIISNNIYYNNKESSFEIDNIHPQCTTNNSADKHSLLHIALLESNTDR